jgi:hypothetical protein
MARSAGRDRQTAICSLSVAFARPKCLATEAAEHSRCPTARQATSARPRAAIAHDASRSSTMLSGWSFAVIHFSSSASAPSTPYVPPAAISAAAEASTAFATAV